MIRTNNKNCPIGRYGPNGIHKGSSPTDKLVSAIGNQFHQLKQLVRSISDRKLVNKTGDMDGAASEKKASRLMPWPIRFEIFLFSVRLCLFSNAKSMHSLITDIKTLRVLLAQSVPAGAADSTKKVPSYDVAKVLYELHKMSDEAFLKLSSQDATIAFPFSRERTIYSGL